MEGKGEQPLESRVECPTAARGSDGLTHLMKDLILSNDDRIPPHRHSDGMSDDGLIEVQPASFGNVADIGSFPVGNKSICLDTVAGLDDEAGVMGGPFAGVDTKALALLGRYLPCMCHQRHKTPRFVRH